MCCTIIKYGLYLANLFFAFTGLILIRFGIVLLFRAAAMGDIAPSKVNGVLISLILIGGLIFIISFFGCCGAINERRYLLILYVIFMLLLAAGKVVLAAILIRHSGNIRDTVNTWLAKAFDNVDLRETFHKMESSFQCCGTTGPESYTGVLLALPPSCCPDSTTCNSYNTFPGCNDLVGFFIEFYGKVVGIVILIIIAVEFAAMILSLSLSSNVRNKRNAIV